MAGEGGDLDRATVCSARLRHDGAVQVIDFQRAWQVLEWDVQQACARGEELAGVRRPCGATALNSVG